MKSDRLAWIVVVTVTGGWFLSTFILPVVVHGYTPPPSVGTVMGSVAGGAGAYLFAQRAAKKNGDEDEPEPEPEEPVRKPRAKRKPKPPSKET